MSLQPKPKRSVAPPKPKTQPAPKKKTFGSVLNAKSWSHRDWTSACRITSVCGFAQEQACFWDVSLFVRWHSSVRTVGRLLLSWELFCAFFSELITDFYLIFLCFLRGEWTLTIDITLSWCNILCLNQRNISYSVLSWFTLLKSILYY